MGRYVVRGIERDFLAVKVEIDAEVLLGGGVEESGFKRGRIGIPVAEEDLADVHSVVVGEGDIEDGVAELICGKGKDEISPCLLLLASSLQHLHGLTLTICSFSILNTR